MKIEHKGTIIYLEVCENILLKRVIQYVMLDNLLTKLFSKEDVEKLRWLEKNL